MFDEQAVEIYSKSLLSSQIMECHDCGLLHAVPILADGTRANCSRCKAVLHRYRDVSLDHALAYTCAALVCFFMANFLPFITLELSGRTQVASLFTGIQALYDQGLWELAGVVGLTMMVAPGLQLTFRFLVLAGLQSRNPPRWLPLLYRVSAWFGRWAMIEVYLLGVAVAYVKLIGLANVEVGYGAFAVGFLMLATVASSSMLDDETVWRAFERRGLVPARSRIDLNVPTCLCEACGLVSNPAIADHARCPRCSARLHYRKPDSLRRTSALVVTAAILFIPANLFPVMTVISLGKGAPDTIISGVIALADAGMWPLAFVVFFASIVVPILKLVGLVLLLITTRRGSIWRLQDRTLFYRIIETVGRWSMIDIFMISILVALVQLGQIATIEPGIGAIAFAGVVIVTIIASESFDPRLMWDAAGKNPKEAAFDR